MLRELAQTIVKTLIPPYTVADFKEGILAACHQLAGWGITSFHDAAVGREAMTAYAQELLAENNLPLRVGMMIPGIPLLEFPGYLDELKAHGHSKPVSEMTACGFTAQNLCATAA